MYRRSSLASVPAAALAVWALLTVSCHDAEQVAGPPLEAAKTGAGPAVMQPSNATAVGLSTTEISLGWQDNSTNETGFEVHRSTTGASGPYTLLTTVGANVQFYINTALAPLTTHCYKVRAVRARVPAPSYSAFSNSACATTLAPPPPPPPYRVSWAWAEDVGGTSVTIKWFDTYYDEEGFRIQRSPDGLSLWESAGTVGADVTSFTTTQPVWYRVIVFNAGGDAPPSDAVLTAPGAPTNLTLVVLDPDNFELAWSDNSGIEESYEVWFGGTTMEDWDDQYLIAELPANSTGYRGTFISGFPEGYPRHFMVQARRDSVVSGYAEVQVP